MRKLLLASVCAVAAVAASVQARAASVFELNFWLSGPKYEAKVPLCDTGWALWQGQQRFAEKETIYWNSGLRIVGFQDIRETAFRPGHYAQIPRRFCSGYALISDGSRRPVYYSIAEDTGPIGVTWGLEMCVVGLDRNWAYSPSCKMARP